MSLKSTNDDVHPWKEYESIQVIVVDWKVSWKIMSCVYVDDAFVMHPLPLSNPVIKLSILQSTLCTKNQHFHEKM